MRPPADTPHSAGRAAAFTLTLDDVFRRSRTRRPDAIALIDPADKLRITGVAPLQLSFAEADRMIGSIAAAFHEASLPRGSVVAVQLPNIVEAHLTILAGLRAGLVVALIPQLWREADLIEALNRTTARAIVTTTQIDGVQHAMIAMNAAAGAFSVRRVFSFGDDCPDGATPLQPALSNPQGYDAPHNNPMETALITFDLMPDGPRIVPRNQTQILAGGLSVTLEASLPQGASVLSCIAPSSFAGLATGMMSWLLSGGTLALHHPFDERVLQEQLAEHACDVLVAPAGLALRLDQSGTLAELPDLRRVVGLWRAPEMIAASAEWMCEHASLTDLYVFGEAGLFGATRGHDGAPVPIAPGLQSAPRGVPGSSPVGEIIVTAGKTLALRGGMIAPSAYAPVSNGWNDESLADEIPVDYVDTQYGARLDVNSGTLRITAPPPSVLGVGGYRFLSRDLHAWSERLGQGSLLTALPNDLNGHRLAGHASDKPGVRAALTELGLNPLMVEAFRSSV